MPRFETLLRTVFTLVFAFLMGCSPSVTKQQSTPDKDNSPEFRFTKRANVIRLANEFASADVSQSLSAIDFSDRRHDRYLSHGWSPTDARPNARWTVGPCAVVEVPRSSTTELQISLSTNPIPKALMDRPTQQVFVSWNNTLQWSFQTADQVRSATFTVPSDAIFHGLNTLEIRPDSWFVPALKNPTLNDRRRLGVWVSSLKFSDRHSPASASQPLSATLDGTTIIQYPNSVISFYLHPLDSPSLKGKGRLKMPEHIQPIALKGEIVLSVRGDNVEELVPFRTAINDMTPGVEIPIELDIRVFSRTAVSLSLCFALESADHETDFTGISFEWDDIQIESRQNELVSEGLKRPDDQYNVVFVLLDALRTDHVGIYGSKDVQTPHIDKFCSTGVLFLDAAASASYTKASVASLFTSTHPWLHGVLTQLDVLSDDMHCLAEVLKEAGYTTVSLIDNSQVSPVFGFGQGFDKVLEWYSEDFRELRSTSLDRNLDFWNIICKPALEEIKGEKFFAYIHLIDPHSPYTPLPEFEQMYSQGYEGTFTTGPEVLDLIRTGVMLLEPADIAYLNSLYKGEITSVDRYMGWFMEWLEANNLTRNTLVVFLSDHGEAFMAHGDIEHGRTLYQELLHVPLCFSIPGTLPEGAQTEYPAALLDVAPTILDILGIAMPDQMQGRSLFGALAGAPVPDDVHLRFGAVRSQIHSVRRGDMKLIKKLVSSANAPIKHYQSELYDLTRDPDEKVNLWSRKPIEGKYLHQMLVKALASSGGTTGHTIDPETIDPNILQNLKDLGYIR